MDDSSKNITDSLKGVSENMSGGGDRLEFQFQTLRHLYTSRSADGYEAIDNKTEEKILLWKLRVPLKLDGQIKEQFENRFKALSKIPNGIPLLKKYSLDSRGIGYVSMRFVQGTSLTKVSVSWEQKEKLFIQALRIVSDAHQKGIVFGDISEESFIVDDHQRVYLVSLMGTFEEHSRATSDLPSATFINYLAPEQRSGATATTAADVYALGVLGYKLFTGRYMFGDQPANVVDDSKSGLVPPPSSITSDLPGWADSVIGKAVSASIESRYSNAKVLLDDLSAFENSRSLTTQKGKWSSGTMTVSSENVEKLNSNNKNWVIKDGRKSEIKERKEGESAEESHKPLPKKLIQSLIGIIAVLLCVVIWVTFFRDVKDPLAEKQFAESIELVPPHLKPLFKIYTSNSRTFEERSEALKEIIGTEDPLVEALLIPAVKNAPSPELRKAGEQGIVERLAKRGLSTTALLIARWFAAVEGANQNPGDSQLFILLLHSADPKLPLDERRKSIHQIYAEEPVLAMQLAASLSLDDSSSEQFVPVLRQMIIAQRDRKDLKNKPLEALIISEKTLAIFFDQQIIKFLDRLSEKDLLWVLTETVSTQGTIFFDIANEISKQKVVGPFQQVFLESLTSPQKYSLTTDQKRALSNGVVEKQTVEDIGAISRWASLDVEKVLLASCAVAKDEDVAKVALESLGSRSLNSEPAKSLVSWARKSLWDHRAKLAKPIGIMGLSQVAGIDQIKSALDMLVPYNVDGALLTVLVESDRPELVQIAMERLAGIMPSETLMPLLTHKDKSVRIKAVESLEGRNQLHVLQAVVKAYEKEEDPEVRQVYCDHHWSIKERRQCK